jgi:hypothetical protein
VQACGANSVHGERRGHIAELRVLRNLRGRICLPQEQGAHRTSGQICEYLWRTMLQCGACRFQFPFQAENAIITS